MLDFILWYLVISFIGLLALPVVYRFLPFLTDRGYTLARTAGLLIWAFLFWLLATLHILQNDIGGVLIALGLLGGLSLWAGGGIQAWRDIFTWLKGRTRLVVISEGLFLIAFIFMAVLRAAYPDISGTEKPMELAFINSILHSPSFPPADPWLSGYSISYYYFGYVMVAMLTRITGVVSGVAFNLAISTVFALTALGAYGIMASLLAAWSQKRLEQGKRAIFSQGWALLAPVFILILSNLEGGFEVLHAEGVFWPQNGQAEQSTFWSWLGVLELNQPPSLPYQLAPNRPGGIWWWRASRVIQDYNAQTDVVQAIPGFPFSSYIEPMPNISGPIEVIDEFPFFTFYLADLHPHVLAMPFVMLAIALALNLFFRGAQESIRDWQLLNWIQQAEFWLTALVLGALGFINTWDFPIYVALFSASFTWARFRQLGWKWWPRIKDFGMMAIALVVAGFVLFLPFYVGFSSQAGGLLPSLIFFTRGVNFWIMFGALLVPIIFWLLWLGRRQGKLHQFRVGLIFALWVVGGLWVGSYLLGILGLNLASLGGLISTGGGGFFSRIAASLISWGSLFLGLQGGNSGQIFWESLLRRLEMPGTWLTLLFMLAGVWALLASFKPAQPTSEPEVETEPDPSTDAFEEDGTNPNGFVLLMVLVGIGLTLMPEFVYLRDQFGTRMNTIFKFYFQTWMLWGLAATFATVVLWTEMRGKLAGAGRTLALVMGLVGLVYPFFGLSDRINLQQVSTWTLDGNSSLAQYSPDEWGAMEWLSQAPYGVIVEAVGGSYSAAARMATHSGLPDVLGWPGHESQWRGGAEEMGSRQQDISTLYRTQSWADAQSILDRYQIRYVVVGNLERSTYQADSAQSLRALDDQKFQSNLNVAFQSGSVTIYEYNPLSQSAGNGLP